MHIPQAEQIKLSQAHLEPNEYQKTLKDLLSIDANEEYKKEVFIILDNVNKKINELDNISFYDDKLIPKITKKHQEVKELFHKIINLSSEFQQDKVIELTLDYLTIKDINVAFIISYCLIHKIENRKYDKKKNYYKILEILEKAINQIKEHESRYLGIKEKKLIDGLDYYLLIVIDINYKIFKTEEIFPTIRKGFSSNNLHEKNRLDSLKYNLKELIYNLISHVKEDDQDFIVTLKNITWEQYDNLTATIGDASWCRISYCDGVLELMTTGERHENINRTIEGLIISYFDYREIGYIPVGSATYKAEGEKKGKEADSAYKFTEEKEFPDFAVEVNFSSGGTKSLEIYKTFKTKEVWMWNIENELFFYYLKDSDYIKIESSYFLENVTPQIIKKYISLIEKNKLKITLYKKEFIKELFPNIS